MHLFPQFLLARRPVVLEPVPSVPEPAAAPTPDPEPPARLHGRPVVGLAGRAASELRAGAPTTPYDRPDLALVERELPGSWLLGASARGVQHKFRGEPRQDAFGVASRGDSWIVVVADGVGQFDRSHVAADTLVSILSAGLADGQGLDELIDRANTTLFELAHDGDGPLASTLLVAEVTRLEDGRFALDLAWTGDPSAYALRRGEWEQLNSFDSHDEAFASTASAALPATEPDVRRRSLEIDADALFFMTDGVGTPLAGIREVRETLAGWWSTPPSVHEFAAQIEFARRGYMDDRTVVGLWATDTGRSA